MTRLLSLLPLLALAALGVAQKPAPARKPAPKPHKNAEGQLVCPVMKTVVPSAKAAAGFSDHKGVRYYFCCGGCKPRFDKNPAAFLVPKKTAPVAPAAPDGTTKSVKVGKYVIELWPPEDGVFAGEPIDIEFGVFDATRKESDGGLAGVEGVAAKAVVTMPSMAGMPEQRPTIHREGRAGVQGLELFFPHGGEYKIDLVLTPKGEATKRASFTLDVGDERPSGAPRARAPYELQVVDFPAHAMPGEPVDLKLRVVDTKTGEPVRAFDVAHEQRFHLLLASKDLSRFLHEHPEMDSDGTWTYRATFPAGGEWWVYGDVAPEGKGSRILVAKIALHGEGPKGTSMAAKGLGPSTMGGLTGRLEPTAGAIPLGKTTTLRVRLTDAAGRPVGDTEPYLGAAGHLMIIHEDGATVVHSHPHEDAKTAALVKKGEILFTARFPKPGRYVAYAQFQRAGEIKTLGFTLRVK